MKLRTLGNTGLQVSEVGLGCEHLQGAPESTVHQVIDAALSGGVNILDIFMSEPNVRTNIGNALKGRREKVILQGHIGAAWLDGQYAVKRDAENSKRFLDDLLTRLQTDYLDIGMIHFLDDPEEWDRFVESDALAYIQSLKAAGAIRAIGMSCHNPITALKAVKSGVIEVMMFSLNPAYDMMPGNLKIDDYFTPNSFDGRSGMEPMRAELYQACVAKGVGITVMKALGAGTLLSDKASPFGKALTVTQCVHYALTRPSVCSVLVGAKTDEEVRQMLAYEQATDAEKDYVSALAGTTMTRADGRCMYCNHCLPCPSGIDIAAVNRYYDIVEFAEETAETSVAHYRQLSAKASDCIACGECEARCPFGVPVREKMERAVERFGE